MAAHLFPFLLISILLPCTIMLGFAWAFRWRWIGSFERALSRLAERRGLSVIFVGAFAFFVSMAVSLLLRMPQPYIHDEFSYLLAADTFAHGRLTNPTHPLWQHFESFHIIQRPTYMSKYPPAQGMILAVGRVLTGYPAAGLWLSNGLACAALCWMLMAWMPPRWALLGGLLAPLHPIVLAWSQCYWGGAVAMGGGALVLGAVRRLTDLPRRRDGLILGLGIAVLANSRPYEGLVLTAIALIGLVFFWMRRSNGQVSSSWSHLCRVSLPCLSILVACGLWMGYDNFRVTGSPLTLPYNVHEATYVYAPILLWQHPRPMPIYHHAEMRSLYVVMNDYSRMQQTPMGWVSDSMEKAKTLSIASLHILDLSFYRRLGLGDLDYHPGLLARSFGFIPLMGLLGLPSGLRRSSWARYCLFGLAIFLGMLSMDIWVYPHYAAPAVGLLAILYLSSLRTLRLWRWQGRPLGRSLTRQMLIFYILSFGICCLQISHPGEVFNISPRNAIAARLNRLPDHQLVVVRYAPWHNSLTEYVYNDADIDHSKIVWAREMDASSNESLLSYFHGRSVWLLEADAQPPRLTAYPQRGQPSHD